MAHAGAFPLVCAACGYEPGGVGFVLLGAVARSFLHCVITRMTGEVYGSGGYIFKAQMAFLASFISPQKNGSAKKRDVREAVSSKNVCLVERGKFRHAAAHFMLGLPACLLLFFRPCAWPVRCSDPVHSCLPDFPDASMLTPFVPQFSETPKKEGCRRRDGLHPNGMGKGSGLPGLIIDGGGTGSYPALGGPTLRWGKF